MSQKIFISIICFHISLDCQNFKFYCDMQAIKIVVNVNQTLSVIFVLEKICVYRSYNITRESIKINLKSIVRQAKKIFINIFTINLSFSSLIKKLWRACGNFFLIFIKCEIKWKSSWCRYGKNFMSILSYVAVKFNIRYILIRKSNIK